MCGFAMFVATLSTVNRKPKAQEAKYVGNCIDKVSNEKSKVRLISACLLYYKSVVSFFFIFLFLEFFLSWHSQGRQVYLCLAVFGIFE